MRRGKDEMSKKLYRVLVPVLALAVALTAVAVAGGATASKKAPKKATEMTDGKVQFKVNKFFKEGYHFHEGKITIASGGTLRLIEKTGEDHTFSLVAKQPKTLKAANNCFGPTGVCGPILAAHGATEDGPPTNPLVNVGADGFDQPGDSVILPAKSKNTKVTITAKAGTRLKFMCVFHPQMQGVITVKK